MDGLKLNTREETEMTVNHEKCRANGTTSISQKATEGIIDERLS